ncbi:MAG: acetate kinase [Myxococcota bacterium]
MQVLVLNCGSSSIKYQLFAMPKGEVLARGLVERIGEAQGEISQQNDGKKVRYSEAFADHTVALHRAVELLTHGETAPLRDVADIGAVGHRVVHGGEQFTTTVRIDEEVVAALEAHVSLAPLHNPPNLLGIRVARELLPKAVQVAVFDTAFHQTMPEHAYLYALPQALYREAGIRRYGFHGTSHRFVASAAAHMLGKPLEKTNLITCHLGNGSSVAAIRGGASVDTSMGLTPLEGLVMGTRAGDMDPAIIFHLVRQEKMTIDEIDKLLNKKSGLLGLSGVSNDVRELLVRRAEGDKSAALALQIFAYRLRKYIGSYLAVLGEVDAVVFTAGIGENAAAVRADVVRGLEPLGISIDPEKNERAIGVGADISSPKARTRVLVVPTNEEKLIAQDTYELASG